MLRIPGNLEGVLEYGEASIEAVEISIKQREKLLADVERRLAAAHATVKKYGAENLDSDQADELEAAQSDFEINSANLKLEKIELKQARRNARRIRTYMLWTAIKKAAFWGFVLWIMYLMFWAPEKPKPSVASSTPAVERVISPAPAESIPLPRPRPKFEELTNQ